MLFNDHVSLGTVAPSDTLGFFYFFSTGIFKKCDGVRSDYNSENLCNVLLLHLSPINRKKADMKYAMTPMRYSTVVINHRSSVISETTGFFITGTRQCFRLSREILK